MFAPWAIYPGPAVGTTVVVPYSAVQAGLIARLDAATQNPNLAAAGINGVTRSAIGLTQTWTDQQRQTLNEQGVTVAVTKYGTIRTYGARSAAGPAELNWMWFGGARVVMAVAHRSDAIGENFVLRQIDGQGVLFSQLNSALKGMLLEFYGLSALYGATPEEAFNVNTGSSVNTPDTIAAGEVHAVIRLKTSPTAEWVHIVIIKTALDRPLAA
jgi:phage tail sheath protein FI